MRIKRLYFYQKNTSFYNRKMTTWRMSNIYIHFFVKIHITRQVSKEYF